MIPASRKSTEGKTTFPTRCTSSYILDLASSPRVSSQAGLLGLPSAMRLSLLLVAALAACASAFVAPAPASAMSRSVAFDAMASPISMTSANKKAKAATRKQKSSRAAAKRFKVTSTGKLLRHYAGKVRHTTAYLLLQLDVTRAGSDPDCSQPASAARPHGFHPMADVVLTRCDYVHATHH